MEYRLLGSGVGMRLVLRMDLMSLGREGIRGCREGEVRFVFGLF